MRINLDQVNQKIQLTETFPSQGGYPPGSYCIEMNYFEAVALASSLMGKAELIQPVVPAGKTFTTVEGR